MPEDSHKTEPKPPHKPAANRHGLGRRPFLEGLFTKVGSVALTSGFGPLATLPEMPAGSGLASRALAVTSINFLSEESQLRLQELVAPLEQVKTPEQQEAQLLEMSRQLLETYKNCETVGNLALDAVVTSRPKKYPEYDEAVRDQRRQAVHLVEDGIVLLNSWGALKGDFQAGFKNRSLKLNFAGRTIEVHESIRDFHLVLNLIKARLSLLSDPNPLKKELSGEDYEDMMAFLDIDPAMDVKADSWVIMPSEWMTNIARVIRFLDRRDILPPGGIIIDPPIDPSGDQVKITPTTVGFYEYASGNPFPERTQALNFYPRRVSKALIGQTIAHELGHYVADAIRIPERLIGLKPQYPHHQMQYDQIVGKAVLEYLFKLQANGVKKLDDSALKMFVTEYALRGGPDEDFAEVFAKYCQSGPQFRSFLKVLEKQGLEDIARILEIKYNYMKDTVAGGEVFSFEQRQPRAQIQGWENTHPDLGVGQPDIAYLRQALARRLIAGFVRSAQLRGASLVARIPNDVDQLIALSQPRVWSDLLGVPIEEIKAISTPHPEVSLGLEGKMELAMPRQQGEVRIPLDTDRSYSLAYLETTFRSGDISIIDFSNPSRRITEGTADALKGLNLTSIKATLAFVPKNDHYYIRFAKNPTGDFTIAPLDIWTSAIHRSWVNKYGERLPTMDVITTMKSADQDIILEINNQGKIVQLYHQGTSLGSRKVSS